MFYARIRDRKQSKVEKPYTFIESYAKDCRMMTCIE